VYIKTCDSRGHCDLSINLFVYQFVYQCVHQFVNQFVYQFVHQFVYQHARQQRALRGCAHVKLHMYIYPYRHAPRRCTSAVRRGAQQNWAPRESWADRWALSQSLLADSFYVQKCVYTTAGGDRTSNNYDCQNFQQIFTGVPVHTKHVFMGVPKYWYKFSGE